MKNKLLLVDDEEGIRKVLGISLADSGYKVFTAENGEQALKIFREETPPIVLTDIKMPGMGGHEALPQIKKIHPQAQVIMLTGHGTTESAVNGMKLGAFDYLLKPAHFGELTAKLESARNRKDEQVERIRKAEVKLLLRRSGDI